MKKISINVDIGGQAAPFAVYIGNPQQGHHPLQFQADWLSKERGGTIPAEIMDAVSQLQELADKNKVPLEDLCVYALGSAQEVPDPPQEEAQENEEEQIDKKEEK